MHFVGERRTLLGVGYDCYDYHNNGTNSIGVVIGKTSLISTEIAPAVCTVADTVKVRCLGSVGTITAIKFQDVWPRKGWQQFTVADKYAKDLLFLYGNFI